MNKEDLYKIFAEETSLIAPHDIDDYVEWLESVVLMNIELEKINIVWVLKQCSHYLREYEEIMPLAEHEIETPFIVEDLIKTVDELIKENEG